MALPDFSQMSDEDLKAFLSGQYGSIGIPTLNADNRYGGEGQGTGFYSGGGLDFLTQTPDGFTGPIGAPYDQAGTGGVFGQNYGAWDTMGNMTGSEFAQQDRPSFMDKNGWLAPLLPVGAAGINALLSGGLGTAPATTAVGAESAAATGSSAANAGVNSALAQNAALTGGGSIPGSAILPGPSGATATFGGLTGNSLLTGGGLAPALTTEAVVTGGIGGSAAGGGIGTLLSSLGGMRGVTAGLGALAGGLGTPTGNVTSEQSVPEWLKPYATDLVGKGAALAEQPFTPYGGQRVADPNDAQKRAWEMISQMAGGPSAQQLQAQGVFENLTQAKVPDFANAERISNQYIGQNTPAAQNQYIGQNTDSDILGLARGLTNPTTGQSSGQIGQLGQMGLGKSTTGIGTNALLGLNNPYLPEAIRLAQGDVTRTFDQSVAPRLAAASRASGSFGNSGIQQQEQEAYRNLAGELGRVSSNMRMQDYGLQAQLGEGDLARRLQGGLTDAARNLGASTTEQQFNIGNEFQRLLANANLRSTDLARDSSASTALNNNIMQGGMYDTTTRANDLSRNASLTDILARSNATLAQNDLTRNTGARTGELQFNAQQGNTDISNDIANWNNASTRSLQAANLYPQFDDSAYRRATSLGTVGGQMYGIENARNDADYQEFLRSQEDPYKKLGTYANLYGTARGGNATTSTPAGGNPVAGAVGGLATGIGFYDLLTRGY